MGDGVDDVGKSGLSLSCSYHISGSDLKANVSILKYINMKQHSLDLSISHWQVKRDLQLDLSDQGIRTLRLYVQ